MRGDGGIRAVSIAVVLAFLVAAGCERDRSAPPSAKCTKVGELCTLPSGPLGVCNAIECKPEDTPPCLRCTPQH